MNRRALVLASLATLPTASLTALAGAQRRRSARQRASAKPSGRRQRAAGAGPAARRRRVPAGRGGLTAGHVRTRIITRTFTSTVPITLPIAAPASPYPSTIQVRGLTQGRILNVRPRLIGLSHTFPEDLDILLVAPGNVGVMLMSDAGGSTAVTGVSLTFDQNAPRVVPDRIVTGTYQPSNFEAPPADPMPAPAPPGVSGHSLTRFTNRHPNGTWRLFIQDDAPGGDGGSLAGWSLQIRARLRVPHQHRHGQRRQGQRRQQGQTSGKRGEGGVSAPGIAIQRAPLKRARGRENT